MSSFCRFPLITGALFSIYKTCPVVFIISELSLSKASASASTPVPSSVALPPAPPLITSASSNGLNPVVSF